MPNPRNMPRLRLALFGTVLLTLLLTAWRTACLLAFFDAEIGYFANGAALVILRILEWLALVLLIALPFLIKNERIGTPAPYASVLTMVGAAIAALMLAITAIYLALKGNTMPAPNAVKILAAALCLIGAVYFAHAFTARIKTSTAVLFGYAAILGIALLLMITYFDRYTQMNAPHKLSLHLAFLAIMLALLFEHRMLLATPRPRVHVTLTLAAFLVCTTAGLSNVIAFLSGRYTDAFYLLLDLLCLGFGIYFAGRALVLCLPHSTEEEESA